MNKPGAAFDPSTRQSGVHRTVGWLVAAALLVYVGFMLTTVAGR